MARYWIQIGDVGEEFYTVKQIKNEFKKDAELYDKLVNDKSFFIIKENEKSKRTGELYPVGAGDVRIVLKTLDRADANGDYGS